MSFTIEPRNTSYSWCHLLWAPQHLVQMMPFTTSSATPRTADTIYYRAPQHLVQMMPFTLSPATPRTDDAIYYELRNTSYSWCHLLRATQHLVQLMSFTMSPVTPRTADDFGSLFLPYRSPSNSSPLFTPRTNEGNIIKVSYLTQVSL